MNCQEEKRAAHEVERKRLVEIELDEKQRTRKEARERDALRVQVTVGQRADQIGYALPLDTEAGRELVVTHLLIVHNVYCTRK